MEVIRKSKGIYLLIFLLAIIYPLAAKSDCRKNNPSRLDCSSLSVSGACGVCNGKDAAIFYISNTGELGNGDMAQPTQYRVFRDSAALPILSGLLELKGKETFTVCIEERGTIRLEADQQIGHPGKSRPNEVLSNCVTTIEPDPTPKPSPTPSPDPSPSPEPSPTPSPDPSPSPEPSPTPSPDPSPSPEPSPTPSPDPSPSPEPSPTPSPDPSPTPIPTPILPPVSPPFEPADLDCQIDGPESVPCQGDYTTVRFSGELSLGDNPEYAWSYDCKGGAVVVAGKDASMLLLHFTDPGRGKDVECSISLTLSSGTDSKTCHAALSIPRCYLDCNNEVNGTATVDSCGVCNGDGTSCASCTSNDLEPTLFSIDGNGNQFRHNVRKATQILSGVKRMKRYAKKILLRSEGLYSALWATTWSIPGKTVHCDDSVFCTSSKENEAHKASIATASKSFVASSKKLFRKAKRSKRYSSRDVRKLRKLYRKNRGLLQKNTVLLQEIPDVIQTCQ